MPKCAVKGCSGNSSRSKLHYYRFPKNDADRQQQWVNVCDNERVNINKDRVCSLHFTIYDYKDRKEEIGFLNSNGLKTYNWVLDKNAVPTLNLPDIDQPQIQSRIDETQNMNTLNEFRWNDGECQNSIKDVCSIDSFSTEEYSTKEKPPNYSTSKAHLNDIQKDTDNMDKGLIKQIGMSSETVSLDHFEQNDDSVFIKYVSGKLMWGFLQGWYPAIMVQEIQSKDNPDSSQIVVFWVGENKISLIAKSHLKYFGENFNYVLDYYSKAKISKYKQTKRQQIYTKLVEFLAEYFKFSSIIPGENCIDLLRKLSKKFKRHLDSIIFSPYPVEIERRLIDLQIMPSISEVKNRISWPMTFSLDKSLRKLKVISFGDGISTGYYAFLLEGFDVEYYSCEISKNAIAVSKKNFGNQIVRSGSMESIDENTIRKYGPFDVVLGAPPCKNLSSANNGKRVDLEHKWDDELILLFINKLKMIECLNGNVKLFWILENVASMPLWCQEKINKLLDCLPNEIDGVRFSAMTRKRLWWTNFILDELTDENFTLQDALEPECGRIAQVTKIRTITTKPNSLKQGVEMIEPVLWDGIPDTLWITEIEALFNFPRSFTDVRNLSRAARLELIGNAWCVNTIRKILRSLKKYFRKAK